MMRKLFLVALVFAAGSGCDRPTAPQVRDQIEKTQAALLTGASSIGVRLLDDAISGGLEHSNLFPHDTISLEYDGRMLSAPATVMERVYLPPPSSGAAPYVRRTMILWNRDARIGIALAADDGVVSVTWPAREVTNDASARRLWGRIGFVTQIELEHADAWFGDEGAAAIEPAERVGPCRFNDMSQSMAFLYRDGSAKDGDACNYARYRVHATARLVHRDPSSGRGMLDAWTDAHRTLRVDQQDIPGTRIVTRCPLNTMDAMRAPQPIFGCLTAFNFWRSQSQFAAETGVDLGRMTALEPNATGGPYVQQWIAGSGPAVACCSQFRGAVRYRIMHPNGTVLARGEAGNASADSILKYVELLRPVVRDGSRVLILTQMPLISHNPYTPVIVDLSVLPCAEGMRRNDAPFMGNAYPDGGCYPAANFPKR